jgi:hypothetical protein
MSFFIVFSLESDFSLIIADKNKICNIGGRPTEEIRINRLRYLAKSDKAEPGIRQGILDLPTG